MATSVQDKGAHPVLFTPYCNEFFVSSGIYYSGQGAYLDKVSEAAGELNVSFIDLDKAFGKVISKRGDDKYRKLFMDFSAGLYSLYPDGKEDYALLRETGALIVAQLAIKGMMKNKWKPFLRHVNRNYK